MKIKQKLLNHKSVFLAGTILCILLLTYIQLKLNVPASTLTDNSSEIHEYTDFSLYIGDFTNPVEYNSNFETEDTVILKTSLPENLRYDDSLGFYSLHQNIHIYCDDTLIYEFSRNLENTAFGSTPGHSYNILKNLYEYRGKELLIYINSPYGMNHEKLPTFYIGSSTEILENSAISSFATISTGVIIFIFGLLSIFIWRLFKKYIAKDDLTLYYAGWFSIVLAIWTINEQPIISYYFDNSILTAYISFISLMLMPITLTLFFKELCRHRRNYVWNIILAINYLNLFGTIIIQLLNIKSFKECLSFNQTVFIISLFIVFTYSAIVTFKRKKDVEGKLNFIYVLFLYVAYFVYVHSFYSHKITNLYYGNICVILYIVSIMTLYLKRSTRIMLKSTQTEFFEGLAFTDSLTGLYSRTAYDKTMETIDVKTASYIIVIFDLNNLKYFNDTYGHNLGDKYIKDSADLITQAFSSLGKVYRIGGDEFCVIMKDKGIFEYETATHHLDTLIYNYNKVSEILKINIAYGYAHFDKSIDRNILETRNRADAMMYQKKFYMKQNQVPLF